MNRVHYLLVGVHKAGNLAAKSKFAGGRHGFDLRYPAVLGAGMRLDAVAVATRRLIRMVAAPDRRDVRSIDIGAVFDPGW